MAQDKEYRGMYRFAERLTLIRSAHKTVHEMCAAYREDPDCEPEIIIRTGENEIAYERERSAQEDLAEGRKARAFPDAYLETLAVYRQLAEAMPTFDTFLVHGSCIAVDGIGYLFTAKSGTGKSTHTRLLRELLGSRAQMVNDDKPLARVQQDGTVIFGTPWDGSHHLSANMSVPLEAVCFLERMKENRIRRITKAEALPLLLAQVYRPENPAALKRTLDLLERLDTRFYRLQCNMDPEAAEVSWAAIQKGGGECEAE